MKEKLVQLITYALQKQATDLHFVVQGNHVSLQLRGRNGMEQVHSAMVDTGLYHYLRYISDLDLGNSDKPQTGSFTLDIQGTPLYFRFSVISSLQLQTGVLRILNNHDRICLHDLSEDEQQHSIFLRWTKQHSGMVILSGPTGSGKTTTLHALLDEIAQRGSSKIMTLEDPIELYDDRYVQLAINEAQGFTYEEGIRQLMRHDPDVIMIGEIRDSYTAKMAYRCALTGHMVYSTVHAKNAQEAIKRMNELGVTNKELKDTLTAVCAQRLYPRKEKEKERVCIYEILEGKNLQRALAEQAPIHHITIQDKIIKAMEQGLISKTCAEGDVYTEAL